MNKVLGGTPNHSDSMCVNCRNAHIIRGLADSSARVYCRNFTKATPMQQPVIDCNLFDDKRTPSRWDMENIAWVLVTNKAGKAVGFVSNEDFKKSNLGEGPSINKPIGF